MKKILFLLSFISIFIISCGSENKKSYTISDDHNGTTSPRLKKIITKTADNNKSLETIIRYTYNKENLLISKKKSYVKKPSKDEGTQDIQEITYIYNSNKQLKNRDFKDLGNVFNRSGTHTEYNYGDIIYAKTKLPVVDSVTINSRSGTCVYRHTYILDASNLAISIDKITPNCQATINDYNNTSISGEPIYNKDISKHTEGSNTYVLLYNNGLLESTEYYNTSSDTNTSNYILEKSSQYIYENKPYYLKQSPTIVVDLPH